LRPIPQLGFLGRRDLSAHHPVGVSTGYMEDMRDDWPALVDAAIRATPFAAELSALAEPELDGLIDYLCGGGAPALPFTYLSVHAPTKALTQDDRQIAERLCALPPSVDVVVIHPDTIEDPAAYERLGWRVVIENMDERKPTGQLPGQLDDLFAALPEAGFCFDVAHAWSVDPTMELANDLLDRFRDRLRHVHLSSLDDDGHHVTLTEEHEELFTPILDRCRDVPWIFEAPAPAHWAPRGNPPRFAR
jgi:hypothetical protein